MDDLGRELAQELWPIMQAAALWWGLATAVVGAALGLVVTALYALGGMFKQRDGRTSPVQAVLIGGWLVGTTMVLIGTTGAVVGGVRAGLDGLEQTASVGPTLTSFRAAWPEVSMAVLDVGAEHAPGVTVPPGGVVAAMTEQGWEMPVSDVIEVVEALVAALDGPDGEQVHATLRARIDAALPTDGDTAWGTKTADMLRGANAQSRDAYQPFLDLLDVVAAQTGSPRALGRQDLTAAWQLVYDRVLGQPLRLVTLLGGLGLFLTLTLVWAVPGALVMAGRYLSRPKSVVEDPDFLG